jgi:hypothetical protein
VEWEKIDGVVITSQSSTTNLERGKLKGTAKGERMVTDRLSWSVELCCHRIEDLEKPARRPGRTDWRRGGLFWWKVGEEVVMWWSG